MFDLTNKVVLITGSTGGIGRAITKAVYNQGATVVLSGTRQEKLDAFKAEFEDTSRVFTVAKKLNTEEDAKSLIDEAIEKAGSISVLVNNAGITKDTLAMRMSGEDWDDVLNVNLKMPFLIAKSAIRPMMKNKFGRIINMSSIVGAIGNAGQCNYSASKGGLVAMSKSLAKEVSSRGITVNAIAPGFIATPMTDELTDDQKEALTKNIPMGSLGQPEDIANAVVFLASDEARYITGETIHVNGGLAMI